MGELQARGRVRDDLSVPGIGDDEHDEPVNRQLLEGGADEREVPVLRRVEGTAEDSGCHAWLVRVHCWMPGSLAPSQARTQGAPVPESTGATEDAAWRSVIAGQAPADGPERVT